MTTIVLTVGIIIMITVLVLASIIVGFLVKGDAVQRTIMVASLIGTVIAVFALWITYKIWNVADFYVDVEARANVYTQFIQDEHLHALYKQIYPDAVSVEEHAVVSMMAQIIDKELQAGNNDPKWVIGILPWISTQTFRTYWLRNRSQYSTRMQQFVDTHIK